MQAKNEAGKKFRWWWIFSHKKLHWYVEGKSLAEASKFIDKLMVFGLVVQAAGVGFIFDSVLTVAAAGAVGLTVIYGLLLLFFVYSLVDNIRQALWRLKQIHDAFGKIEAAVKEAEEQSVAKS